jgi:hypothetical protein
MFYNQFRRHDATPFYRWWPELPCEDAQRNAAIADYRLNQLVLFLTGTGHIDPYERFMYPRLAADGVTFPSQLGEDGMDFFVRHTTNILTVFQADGSSQEFPLAAGEAKRIHKEMKHWPPNLPPDLADILATAYAQRHPPMWVSRLREATGKHESLQDVDGKGDKSNC